MKICIICKKDIEGYGHNARPIASGRCCDRCNFKVIKRRLFDYKMIKSNEN